MQLVHPLVETYAEKFTSPLDGLRDKVEQETLANHEHSVMISGQVQGIFLEMISRMIKPMRILEIGSFTGFSALCLAKGLQPGGVLHTIELRENDAALCEQYFKEAGVEHQIKLHCGNALNIIPSLKEAWDLVFIDADKVSYIQYYELTLQQLKPGGFILADNVFFHGEVLEEKLTGKNAKAMAAFNEFVARDNRVQQVMLTIRDGLMIIRKL
ncbi:MAG TPA: O-methyltransferase [Ferruginibacter sp.]|jgi:predicted O-methyltransferase YrrM|nr:O-methyltransferase [Bacteroidota bacterium]MBS1926679.1 O-methyltransferase [Bacteroidota bacterium]MCC6692321.1 O-methyltransferase [Chitinophagaceae bacterium]HMT95137.1 O-methyltransferase [Ferruginibacter sp.]HMU24632.1 O-methyltransferase [Ferruginibacter sp.]